MADTATLTGTITAVTDSDSTHSVITITATFNGATVATTTATLTGSGNGELSGTYSISGLPAGECGIKFVNVNFTTANETTNISLSKPNVLNTTLTPKGVQF
jgi:hypothetical protein